jgi:hypothetical protein
MTGLSVLSLDLSFADEQAEDAVGQVVLLLPIVVTLPVHSTF